MAYLTQANKSGPAKKVDFFQGLAQDILRVLGEEQLYPSAIAKQLSVHEQKIYYHIRKLEKEGYIEVKREEEVKGSVAKYYGLTAPVFYDRFGPLHQGTTGVDLSDTERSFLEPFIKDGVLSARIVVGSPDPHGPEKARSRDGYYGIDLALFLGKYARTVTHTTLLDTEFRSEHWQDNLILLGGPVTNRVVAQINNNLPIRFCEDKQNTLLSKNTQREYVADEIGVVQKITNPHNPRKAILVIAGKRYQGTRAAILAVTQYFETLVQGKARVVEGIDLDSDGIIDAVEFLE